MPPIFIQKLVNQDGLVYADLDFPVGPRPSNQMIHKREDMTTYADVDPSKKADPLPDDSDEE